MELAEVILERLTTIEEKGMLCLENLLIKTANRKQSKVKCMMMYTMN